MTHLAYWKLALRRTGLNPLRKSKFGNVAELPSRQTFSADTFHDWQFDYSQCSNRFGAQPSSTTLSAIRHNATWRRTEM